MPIRWITSGRACCFIFMPTSWKKTPRPAPASGVWTCGRFFTWHRDFNGNERLQVLAPIEPAVPDNRGIERNWSPLWSLWRAENNPKTGAASQSLLWNLYRR